MLDRADEYRTTPGGYGPRFPIGSRVRVVRSASVPKGPPDATGKTPLAITYTEKLGTVHGFRFNEYGADKFWVRFDDRTERTELSISQIDPAPRIGEEN